MAERRMFAKSIIESDAFIDMPVTARLLYYDLGMRADDDGFVNSAKSIMRSIGAKLDDLKLLAEQKFIIDFGNGVIVIKHWKIHNYVRKDTYSETKYKELKARLEFDENNSYRLIYSCDEPVTNPSRLRDEPETSFPSPASTQDRLGKDRLGKDRLGKERENARATEDTRYGIYNNVILTDGERDALMNDFPDTYQEKIDNLSMYMKSKGKFYRDHYATIMKWEREDKEKDKTQKAAAAYPPKQGSAEDLANFNKMIDEMIERNKGGQK